MTCWPRTWRGLQWFCRVEEAALKVGMGSGSWGIEDHSWVDAALLVMKILTVYPNLKLKIGTY